MTNSFSLAGTVFNLYKELSYFLGYKNFSLFYIPLTNFKTARKEIYCIAGFPLNRDFTSFCSLFCFILY